MLRKTANSAERARTAASKIVELVQRTATEHEDWAAWGQFVDDRRNRVQTGIYGTSAAVLLLTEAHGDSSTGALSLARTVLAEELKDDGPRRLFNDPEDPSITYKLASLVEATPPERSEDPLAGVAATLVQHMAPEGGWAHYFDQVRPVQPEPQVLPSAVVLFALRRHRAFRVLPECRVALEWLSARVSEDADLPPAILAMCALALQEYRTESDTVPAILTATDTALKRLRRWALRRVPPQIGEHYEFHYSIRLFDRAFNHYLFLLPDCLAALVFLHANNPRSTRGYLRLVARRLSEIVVASDGFTSPNSLRKATADQLWVSRVLRVYSAKPLAELKGVDYLRLVRMTKRELGSASLFGVLTLGFAALSVSSTPLLVRTLAAIGAAVFAGVASIVLARAAGGDG